MVCPRGLGGFVVRVHEGGACDVELDSGLVTTGVAASGLRVRRTPAEPEHEPEPEADSAGEQGGAGPETHPDKVKDTDTGTDTNTGRDTDTDKGRDAADDIKWRRADG